MRAWCDEDNRSSPPGGPEFSVVVLVMNCRSLLQIIRILNLSLPPMQMYSYLQLTLHLFWNHFSSALEKSHPFDRLTWAMTIGKWMCCGREVCLIVCTKAHTGFKMRLNVISGFLFFLRLKKQNKNISFRSLRPHIDCVCLSHG